jgi:hypothetical protein
VMESLLMGTEYYPLQSVTIMIAVLTVTSCLESS